MIGTTEPIQFEEGGRRYTCRVETPQGARTGAWWWVDVSGDGHRYAPFQAADSDSEDSVRSRVVAYYEDRLARRNWTWRDRGASPSVG